MKKYLSVLILLFLIFSILNCSSDKTIIYGQYLTNPGKSLRGYRMQFGLIGEDQERYNYYTNLSRNGKFKIKVKEKGTFVAFIGLNQYPPRDVVPYISTDDGRIYIINTLENKKILIDKYLYITEPLKIFLSNDRESISTDENYLIKWQKDIFAEAYLVSLVKRNEESMDVISSINAYTKELSITVKELFALPVIEGVLDIDIVESLMPFVRINGELSSGKYFLSVSGYRRILEENRDVETTITGGRTMTLTTRSDTTVINLIVP